MRRNAPYEEEAFFHLFCVFSKTNRGQNYAATLIACCLLQLNFKLRGSLCPLLWSFQSLPARPLPSKPCSKNQIAWTFIGYISVKQPPPQKKELIPYFECSLNSKGNRRRCDLWSFYWTLDGAIQLARKPQSQSSFAICDCWVCGTCGCLAWKQCSWERVHFVKR